MSTAVENATRTFTITLPEYVARDIEDSARREQCSVEEFLKIALRAYALHQTQIRTVLSQPEDARDEYMTMDEVNAYVHEQRRADRELKSA